jgi:mannose-P-dolichol utilization defect protein 1
MDALRSAIQPITHSFPAPLRDLGVSLIGDVCYQSLVLDVDLADTACLKLGISKGLGLGIVAMASVVKVPQILKLARSKSAAGVSFLSYLLETSAMLVALAYNFRNGFPFSTYGETALIAAQNVIICILVLNYSGKAALSAVFVAVLAVAGAALFTESVVSMATLKVLQASGGVVGVASKIPQIIAIFQEGGTGQLSAFTVRQTPLPSPKLSMPVFG